MPTIYQTAGPVKLISGLSFIEQLYGLVNELCDDPDPVRAFAGEQLAAVADLARHLDATSPQSFEDRRQAMLDAAEWSKS